MLDGKKVEIDVDRKKLFVFGYPKETAENGRIEIDIIEIKNRLKQLDEKIEMLNVEKIKLQEFINKYEELENSIS